jgi:hypothetical protein
MSPVRRIQCVDLKAERPSRCPDIAHLQNAEGIVNIAQDCQPAETRYNLAQQFDSFADRISRLTRQAGKVAARSREARDQAQRASEN